MRLTIGTNCASRGCCSVFIHTASRFEKLPKIIPKHEWWNFDSGHDVKFFGVNTRGDDDWAFIGTLAALSLDLTQVMGTYLINRIEPGRVIIQIGNELKFLAAG